MGAAAIATNDSVTPTKPRSRKARAPKPSSGAPDTVVVSPPTTDGMRARVEVALLKSAVDRLFTVTDQKSTIPLLGYVRVRSHALGLTLQATDLNLTLTIDIMEGAWSTGVGGCLLPTRRLRDLVRACPKGIATLARVKPCETSLEVDNVAMNLISMPDADWPKVPSIDEVAWHTIDGGIFRSMIDDVSDSVCKDEARFHLNGALLEAGDDGSTLRMVSTDGHRLTKVTRQHATSLRLESHKTIIPTKALRELRGLLSRDTCEVAFKGPHMFVRQGDWTLAVRLIDAQFPPYDQVIPTGGKLATVDRKALIRALQRSKVMTSDARGSALHFAPGTITVVTDDPDGGTLREVVPCDHPLTKFVIGTNPTYLINALERIEGDHAVLSLGDVLAPIGVRSVDDATMRAVADAEIMIVVMPMRV